MTKGCLCCVNVVGLTASQVRRMFAWHYGALAQIARGLVETGDGDAVYLGPQLTAAGWVLQWRRPRVTETVIVGGLA